MSTDKQPTLQPTDDERQPECLWDTDDVAAYLKVSRSTVRRRVEAMEIPYIRLGGLIRFEPDAVREWAREQAAA